jgi:chaperonin GroES
VIFEVPIIPRTGVNSSMKMLNDNVLILPERPDTTHGGIALPDQVKSEFVTGKVIDVGPGQLLESGERGETQVKPGDRVKYIAKRGYDITLDGKNYKVTNETCVVMVL